MPERRNQAANGLNPDEPELHGEPIALQPYIAHGVDLQISPGTEEALAICPFCEREKKFSVNINTGVWQCWACRAGTSKEGGNAYTFIRMLWDASFADTTDYSDLADERGLLYADTLEYWGVCRSLLTGGWLIPGYGIDLGKGATDNINQLYRYVKRGERMLLLPTPGLDVDKPRHGIMGMAYFDPDKPDIAVCEGPWDGMVLWELLRTAGEWAGSNGEPGPHFVYTSQESESVYARCNVVSVATATSFFPSWASLFEGKNVMLLLDNDHPVVNPNTGSVGGLAGLKGMKKISRHLVAAAQPPNSISYMDWSGKGEDHNPKLKSGYDVRDLLRSRGESVSARISTLPLLYRSLAPIPDEWVEGVEPASAVTSTKDLTCLPCHDWAALVNQWRKAMKWPRAGEGLDHALAVMLACVCSTKSSGDQLWVKIISPAGTGKSTLAEAISVAKKYAMAVSTIRGFHSGWKGNGEDDMSIAALAQDKTLIIKDGDTLLKAPNRDQILAEARDIYDRVSRVHYRNNIHREYNDHNMTVIICGTKSLRALDQSELGERCIDCVMMEDINDDEEDAVLLKVAYRAERNMSLESSGDRSGCDPDEAKARQLTGGYVNYLRANAQSLLDRTTMADVYKMKCTRYGKLVAYARARPSKHQDEEAEREFAARLVSQMIRLAKCLAVVLNRPEVDAEVMRRVRKVALDTARGKTLSIMKYLYEVGERGSELMSIAHNAEDAEEKLTAYIKFLRKIKVVEMFSPKVVFGTPGKMRYKLRSKVAAVYKEVMEFEYD